MGLLLSTSQDEVKVPYKFNTTNISVYSIEEALYHCYYCWKDCIDEFISDKFISWVRNELNLYFISNKIKELKIEKSFTKRLISFLTVIEYFDSEEIENLKKELVYWENRSQFEKLKEQADNLVLKGYCEKAVSIYLKALEYDKTNSFIINNIGIAYMKLQKYDEATLYFLKAYNLNENNNTILCNLIEAYIFNEDYDNALKFLEKTDKDNNETDMNYFYGEICFAEGRYIDAIQYYNKSPNKENDKYVIFKLTDSYVKLRQYSKALEVLENLKNEDDSILVKKSEVYMQYNDIPNAIKCIEKALFYNQNSVKLWTLLAKYSRLDYNLDKAERAVNKALNDFPNDKMANLEYAKIRKAQGNLKDYQNILNKILYEFKKEYRKINA